MDSSVVLGLTLLIVPVSSLAVLNLLRRMLIRWGSISLPSDRGLHSHPTARGGGIIIALWATGALWAPFVTSQGTWIGDAFFFTSLIIVVVVGFLDDLTSKLSAGTRLLIHFVASACAVLGAHFSGALQSDVVNPLLSAAVLVFIAAWSINAMNFMDGVDGLVSGQLVGVALCVNLLGIVDGVDLENFFFMTVLGLSSAAFLRVNFPPARLFLGDSGSGLIGLAVVVFAVTTTPDVWWIGSVLVIFYSLFIMDTFTTLIWRLLRGKHPAAAHREHVYQLVVQRSGRHQDALLVYIGHTFLIGVPFSLLIIYETMPAVALVAICLTFSGVFLVVTRRLISGVLQ